VLHFEVRPSPLLPSVAFFLLVGKHHLLQWTKPWREGCAVQVKGLSVVPSWSFGGANKAGRQRC
jgi:hypothetical protein